MAKQITVRHGIRSLTTEIPDAATFGDLAKDANIKAALGAAENVRVLVDGVEGAAHREIPSGAVVHLETACLVKQSA